MSALIIHKYSASIPRTCAHCFISARRPSRPHGRHVSINHPSPSHLLPSPQATNNAVAAPGGEAALDVSAVPHHARSQYVDASPLAPPGSFVLAGGLLPSPYLPAFLARRAPSPLVCTVRWLSNFNVSSLRNRDRIGTRGTNEARNSRDSRDVRRCVPSRAPLSLRLALSSSHFRGVRYPRGEYFSSIPLGRTNQRSTVGGVVPEPSTLTVKFTRCEAAELSLADRGNNGLCVIYPSTVRGDFRAGTAPQPRRALAPMFR
ncbi:hypothetical protein GY45DRAFT_415403 [Cubamyces sp. BRFM 1775]|nr:hypothetical protein GY45DRAFT_415403 [Cubamyces sp. BRFM 1775]